jgi:putative tricarboxylic transport membrane protein
MVLLGLILGTVGIDSVSGMPRFCFGSAFLLDGVGLIPVAMGLFGISEVLVNLESPEERSILNERISNLLPTREDWKRSAGPIARGSVLGFLLGLLPGAGAVMASFLSYAVEKRLSKRPEEFGHGAIEGVAGPETANNAASGAAFVPLLALGIPPNIVMGLLMGALVLHGVTPGPLLLTQHPEIFWGVIASMYLGNVMLVILNLPLVGMWVRVLRVPYKFLMPVILLCCLIGVYGAGENVADIWVMVAAGAAGYLLRRFGYELAPLVLALVLGPLLETNFRNSLTMSDGSFTIFVTRPIPAVVLGLSAVLVLTMLHSKTGNRSRPALASTE